MTIDPEKIDEKSDAGFERGRSDDKSDDKEAAASIASSNRDGDDDSIDAVPEQILTTNGIPVDEEAAVAASTVPVFSPIRTAWDDCQ